MQSDDFDYLTAEQDTRAQHLAIVAVASREQANRVAALRRAEIALDVALRAAQDARAALIAATDLLADAVKLFDVTP